jgi:dTDP-4-dehydrorhamnose reductase
LIHISTDCVFSGSIGNYTEEDVSDATDLYGRTKFLGEVDYPHAVTLRTSIIGRELKSRLGLIEWFLAQEGEIRGYRKAIYSGFTTDELARIIRDFVIPDTDINGIYHVSSDPISKYELLMLTKKEFNKEILIHPDDDFTIDRSLCSSKFKSKTGYSPPSWQEMIKDLAASSDLYDS